MAGTPNSVIARSWSATVGYLVGAAVAGALSALLFKTIVGGAITLGIALLPAVVAVILLCMAFSGSGVCPCPACGGAMSGLSTGRNDGALCLHCHRYFEGKGGLLWATDESRVADSPLFGSPVPVEFAFPDACCICGKPAVRCDTISLQTMKAPSVVTANLLPEISITAYARSSVEVPHCADHKGGALLTGTQSDLHIKFRSYPYLRAFCELNHTAPG